VTNVLPRRKSALRIIEKEVRLKHEKDKSPKENLGLLHSI
jgi:hypothetical protein